MLKIGVDANYDTSPSVKSDSRCLIFCYVSSFSLSPPGCYQITKLIIFFGRIILLSACIGVADWLSIRLSAKWEQDSSLEFSPSVVVRIENSYSITGMITQTMDTVSFAAGMTTKSLKSEVMHCIL